MMMIVDCKKKMLIGSLVLAIFALLTFPKSSLYDESIGRRSLRGLWPSALSFQFSTTFEKQHTALDKKAIKAIEAGQPAFRVHVPPKFRSGDLFEPRAILIKVYNPQPNYQYSVTVTATNKYTGTAMLMWETKEAHVFQWEPILPGKYEVLVHEIMFTPALQLTPLIKPGPYPIFIHENPQAQESSLSILQDRIENSPPCQSMKDNMELFSHWDGDWLGPDFQLKESIRTGWSFVPSKERMNCKLETFDKKIIQSLPTKKSIYIFGRSVERGIFLSLVDMMLETDEKIEMKQTPIGKCWGRMTVQKGNMEVMYQDWRASEFELDMYDRAIQCHNENVVHDASFPFILNATEVWQEVWQQDPENWPDVIHMVTKFMSRHFNFDMHVKHFVDMIPTNWNGVLFLGDYYFSGRDAGLHSQENYHGYLQWMSRMLKKLDDPRVRWLDSVGIAKEMRMYSQMGPDKLTRSQHFHDHEPSLRFEHFEHSPISDSSITVFSNITEMVSNLLLGHALGPKDELMQELARQEKGSSSSVSPSDLPLRWCHACPLCLLPFHIIPSPKMTCIDGPILEAQVEENPNVDGCERGMARCPDFCLAQEPNGSFGTESDTVYTRHCPVES